MTRPEEWQKRLEDMPDHEPLACWLKGCYLAVDPRDGFCECHGLPPSDEAS